jgi:hypothetical protein
MDRRKVCAQKLRPNTGISQHAVSSFFPLSKVGVQFFWIIGKRACRKAMSGGGETIKKSLIAGG